MIWRKSSSIYCNECDRYMDECIGKNEQVMAHRCSCCRTQTNYEKSGATGQAVEYGTQPADYENA